MPFQSCICGSHTPYFPHALWNSRDILKGSDSSIMTCQVVVYNGHSSKRSQIYLFYLETVKFCKAFIQWTCCYKHIQFYFFAPGLQTVIPGLFTSITYLTCQVFLNGKCFCHIAMIMALPFPLYVCLRLLLYCLSLYFYVSSEIMHRCHIKWFCRNIFVCIPFSFLESCRHAVETEKGNTK